jgi:tetratricopeptide (TPR) repeat protein
MAKGFGHEKPKKGHQKRQKAYLNLITVLLRCPSGKEPEILMANQNLLDAGLVKMMGMVAMRLADEGDRESANFLINLANSLAEALGLSGTSVEFPHFLGQMMLAMRSNGNPEAAYPIIQAYLEQDHLFIQRFRSWLTDRLLYDAAPEEALDYALVLTSFGSVIAEFPLGDRAQNVEEAIACHQTALQVITRDTNPQLWGDTQNALAITYCNRIKGDQAENLENAIDAFEKALQVLTREVSPEQWGKIQNNLGNAYRDRIWGDKAENLERAIAAHQNALQVRTREVSPEKWAMTQMNLGADYRQRIEGEKAENLEMAIACYQQALQVYTRQAFPKDWAEVHNNLGNVYRERVFGEKSENLDEAIAAFKAVLQVFTRQSFPHGWAMAQMNLGNAYGQQEKIPEAIACCRAALEIWTPTAFPQDCFKAGQNMGDSAFNAELWSEAMEGYTAAIEAVEQRLSGAESEARRQEIKAEAINIYEQMVKACVNNGQPDLAMKYAKRSGSQRFVNQLANNHLDQEEQDANFILEVIRVNYDSMIDPKRVNYDSMIDPKVVYPFLEANLDKFDEQFAQKWRRVGMMIQSEVESHQLAQVFKQSLDDPSEVNVDPSTAEIIKTAVSMLTFSSLILEFPQGNRGINIEIAIAAKETVSSIFSQELFPEQWAAGQVDLGLAYRNRILGDRGSNLEKAIACYQNALQVFTPETFTETWAGIQNNLAIAYSERIQGDRSQNLEQAIRCCETVLQICTHDTFPEQWANTQSNLGVCYRVRVYGEQVENIELAIRCYQNAMLVHTREALSQNWAGLQENLGVVHVNRIKGEQAENLEEAINYFQSALQIRTRDAFPVDWVRCQTNLGNAYKLRIFDKAENLESAIHCYETALEVATLETMPEQWAMAQLNLATAYSNRIKGNRESNLNSAIRCYEAALQVYTKRAYPQNWATLQNNLGTLYGKLGLFEQEIHCLQASLEVCTREAFPQDWADTQYNLGLAYSKLGLIDRALECFRLSLEVFTPTAFPVDCLLSGSTLGDTAFQVRLWSEAIEGYSLAIEAVETSRTWTISESRRQEILAQAIDVYQNMVQACINAGQLEKAIETVERSRSKRLVDLMASNDLYQSGEIPPEVKELLQRFEDLQQQIDQERSPNNSGNNRELMGVGTSTVDRASFQAYNEAIAALEAEKLQIWEQLRSRDPVLAGEIKVDAPDFCTIQQQLIDQPTSAILSFYTTSNNTYIFILRKHQITLHTCAGEGFEALQFWLRDNWLSPYRKYSEANAAYRKAARDYTQAEKEAKTEQEQQALKDKENAKKELKEKRNELEEIWHRAIERVLQELSQKFQLSELITQHLNDVKELILVPHLLLHQIPFAALPVQHPEYRYLGDKFLIRYTPSCQVLEFCKQRGEVTENLTYGTVEDATNDLPCASFEGEQIAQLCNIPQERRLIGSTQATCNNYRQLVQKIQVLHSCHHAQSRLDNPLESQLKLADGSITLGQLMTPGWRLPNLSDVFLSCCETNLGDPSITDDILTLSTGFLCAGARSVVSTLWLVDDLATALFSIFYYQQRQQEKSRPKALQQAQIKLRELKKEELKELFKQVETKRKQAKTKRNQYPLASVEYLECDREYNKYAGVAIQIYEVKNSQDECPFFQSCYWAAFTCQGLR